MKNLITCILLITCCFFTKAAGSRPEAHFGIYGLEHLPNAQAYQKYVGQTVEYLPEKTPSYDDKKFKELYNGEFKVPYIIQKVSGNDKKIKFELVEKDNPKSKIKFEFLNYPEYYTYGKNTFANTSDYQIPLFFIDKFNEDASQFKDKPLKAQNGTYLNIKGLTLDYPKEGYPVPAYEIENPLSKKTYTVPINLVDEYADIVGKEFTDPDCNFKLTIVDFKKEKRSNNEDKIYSFYNSSNGKIEEATHTTGPYGFGYGTTPAKYAQNKFAEAKSGKYIATLNKVEKPSNSSIRYGTTTEVKDKDITKFSYVDNIIEMVIFATNTQFAFDLKNISPNSIKIIWDEAAFVDSKGSTSKVMHAGTKFAERNSSQPATTIIKNAKIEDVATPTDRVYYSDSLKEWTSESMMPEEPYLEGKQLQLMLPIQIQDVINEYIFVFDLNYVLNHPELLNHAE